MNSNHWKNLAVFTFLVFVELLGWSAIDIFIFGNYEPKFGGPLDNFLLSIYFLSIITAICGAGYFAALFIVRKRFLLQSTVGRFITCSCSGVIVVALLMAGAIENIAENLVVGYLPALVLSFFITTTAIGVVFIYAGSVIAFRPPNNSLKKDAPSRRAS